MRWPMSFKFRAAASMSFMPSTFWFSASRMLTMAWAA